MRLHRLVPPHLPLLLALCACEDPAPARRVSEATDLGLGGAASLEGARLLIRRSGAALEETGPWRARIETAGQLVADVPLGDCPEAESPPSVGCARVGGLAAGVHTVTVFLDRNENGALDACPFPPQLGDAAEPDRYENLVGRSDVAIDGNIEIELVVPIDRRTCGPGDAETGISGHIVVPETLDGGLFMRMSPSTGCESDEVVKANRATVTVSLGEEALQGRVDFSLGELLPGCFDLEFFADGDGDRHPTACDTPPAGGDRAVTRLAGVSIVEGERRALAEVVSLPAAECPETLTGLRGALGLGKALVEAAAKGETGAEALSAHPRIALRALETGDSMDWPLAPDTAPAGAAIPFVLSGLAPGLYDVALYLDGDADQVFSPCGGLNGGVDSIFEQRSAVQVPAEGLFDLGELRLQRSPDCAETDTEIRIRPEVELEEGAVGSGRPVRLELTPIDAGGERRSLLLFENHRDLDARPAGADGAWHLAVRVRPGRYEARIFVDTDRNGVFGSCAVDAFQDRAAAEPLEVTFGAAPLVDLDRVRVPALGCVVPDAAIGPEFVLPPGVAAPPLLYLRFEIAEAGGWTKTFPLREPIESESLPYVQPPLKLAPGSYTLRAWLDPSADGLFDTCDAPTPDLWLGNTTFTLDALNLAARPRIELAPVCLR